MSNRTAWQLRRCYQRVDSLRGLRLRKHKWNAYDICSKSDDSFIIDIYIYIYLCLFTYTYTYVYMFIIYIYNHTYIYVYVVYIYIYIHMCYCTYIYICIVYAASMHHSTQCVCTTSIYSILVWYVQRVSYVCKNGKAIWNCQVPCQKEQYDFDFMGPDRWLGPMVCIFWPQRHVPVE